MEKEYIVKTDLALQNKTFKCTKQKKINNITIKYFKEKMFSYTDIFFENLETKENRKEIKDIFKYEINKYLKKYKIKQKDSVLIVGLGNEHIGSDSIGPSVVSNVYATGHLTRFNKHLRAVYTFTPDVIKNTGMVTKNSVKGIAREIKPKVIIVIDSLISGSIEYLTRVIEITDKGITPGSGVGNYSDSINMKTIYGIPVIAIGVPTAIEASTIIKDALNLDSDRFTFKKGYDLLVSQKDIDIFTLEMGKILGSSLNELLNNINAW